MKMPYSWTENAHIGIVRSFIWTLGNVILKALHFTACRIHDKVIKPCMFKQVETLILVRHQ
jgi:hypothetical protein